MTVGAANGRIRQTLVVDGDDWRPGSEEQLNAAQRLPLAGVQQSETPHPVQATWGYMLEESA